MAAVFGSDGLDSDGDVRRRYAIGALSVVGGASMAASSLLQLGVVSDLPDPPYRLFGLPFNSRKVNLSDEARVFGLRDAPIALGGFLANVPLLMIGGRDRAERLPWLPIALAAKALGEAMGAAILFSKMPRKERAWCAYCIAGAISSATIFALTLPEALRAASVVLRRLRE
jgi:uncharacterized membrane protein